MLAALPYASGYPLQARQVLQYISVGFTREINRQTTTRVAVADAMCDPQLYAPSGFSADGFHPNDAGYTYLSQRLFAIVNAGTSSVATFCSQMTVMPAL